MVVDPTASRLKLGSQRNYHKGLKDTMITINQPTHPFMTFVSATQFHVYLLWVSIVYKSLYRFLSMKVAVN